MSPIPPTPRQRVAPRAVPTGADITEGRDHLAPQPSKLDSQLDLLGSRLPPARLGRKTRPQGGKLVSAGPGVTNAVDQMSR